MRILLSTFCMILTCFALNGQAPACNCNDADAESTGLDDKLTFIVLPAGEANIPETELFSQWRYGKIILNNGEIISGQLMHYDGLTDQLIIDTKNPAIKLAVEKYTIQGFDLESLNSDKIFRFRRINVKGKYTVDFQDVFLQVLISGKNTLYVHRRMVTTLDPKKISRNYSYYIRLEDGTMVAFAKPWRKNLIKLFPEKMDLFRMRLRKLHNHIRNEEQLIMAIDALNTL